MFLSANSAKNNGWMLKILISTNLEKELSYANHSSYKFRAFKISRDVYLLQDFLEELRSKTTLRKIKEPEVKEIQPIIDKRKISIYNTQKIYHSDGISFVTYPFSMNKKIYIIKTPKGTRNQFLYYYDGKKDFKLLKEVAFEYISSYGNNLIGIKIRKFPEFYVLDRNLRIVKKLHYRGVIFPKDVIKKGRAVYIHKKRYSRGDCAVEVLEEGKIRCYFTRVQSKEDELEEVAVADDTIFSMEDSCFYITFTYPDDGYIYLYRYKNNRKVEKISIPIEDGYSGMPKVWMRLDLMKRKIIYDITGVNGIYEGNNYLYIATGRNTIEKMEDKNLQDYLYVLSRDGKKYYGRIKLNNGTPVYYDKGSGYFYSAKIKIYPEIELWRWKVKIKK